MGAFNPRTFRRIATLCDGWNAVFLPPEQVAAMFNTIKQMTKEAGRDPSALTLTVRANGKITEKPLGGDRPALQWLRGSGGGGRAGAAGDRRDGIAVRPRAVIGNR